MRLVSSVTLAFILRLVSIVQEPKNPDVTWTFSIVTVWTLVEANLAVVSGEALQERKVIFQSLS